MDAVSENGTIRSFSFFSPGMLLVVLALAAGTLMVRAHSEVHALNTFKASLSKVAVVPPAGKPEVSQESIDLAVLLYGIKVPPGANHPQLDMKLTDRGLTARGAYSDKAIVTVGPAAFASWSLLASTLGHELEVHCQQNFLFIYIMDLLRLDGTGSAEREAYVYELRNAKRFGLNIEDADMIADTMEYYYPEHVDGLTVIPGVKRWLAKNLITRR